MHEVIDDESLHSLSIYIA